MSAFVSFLKKVGTVLAMGLEITGFISPVLLPLLGSSSSKAAQDVTVGLNDFTAIGTVAVQVETALQGKAGAEKLAAAAPLVANIVRTSELVSGHKIAQEPEFIAGCKDLTNAVVRILNSLDSGSVKASGDPAPAAAPLAQPVPAVAV